LLLAFVIISTWLAVPAGASAQAAPEPEIGARAAIVVEYPSGRILYSKAMHDRLAPASTTKILTSILALEHGNLEDVVTVSPDDMVGESTMGLEIGEQQTLHNLLYGMLLPSGNDAATAVARYLGSQASAPGSGDPMARFIEMMNARAAQLGLADSHFINPHGLDADGHFSSAYDLASLTWYAFQFPTFNEIIKTPFYQAAGHPLKNTNEMLTRYAGTDGVKTGWTDAGGLCLVASATRDGHRLISVVLNAPHWYTDSGAILDYAFAKLASDPKTEGTETLAVAARGTGNWLLAGATQTPPISTPQVMAQGGGAAAAHVRGANGAGGGAADLATDKFVAHASSTTGAIVVTQGNTLPWGVLFLLGALVVLVVAGGWWAIGYRLPGIEPRPIAAYAAVGASMGSPPRAAPRDEERQEVRTLGERPVAARRREPNLMVTPEQACVAHVHRAVSLAQEGRQGSSMAEFLLALRLGCCLNVAEIDVVHNLTPNGFLALYRAQAAAGSLEDAYDTLQYAVAAVPDHRLIAMTLRQFASRRA
jgi:D-alanyl-D-alanine carboxypeptidase (penicillin-binding protein 5/6)